MSVKLKKPKTNKFFTALRSSLRRLWMWYSTERKEALKLAETRDARNTRMWKCSKCLNLFRQKEMRVDHIVPCGSLRCEEDIPAFIRRLLVGVIGLQVLCKACHDEKTKIDREEGETHANGIC